MSAKHWFEEHTGEVQVGFRASNPAELLAEAGRTIAELQRGDLPVDGDAESVSIDIPAREGARLLVDWIDELLFESEVRKLVFEEFDIEVGEKRLKATVRGRHPTAIKTAVKAATLHGLRWHQTDDGIEATVVLDV